MVDCLKKFELYLYIGLFLVWLLVGIFDQYYLHFCPANCESDSPAVPGVDSAIGILPVAMESEENEKAVLRIVKRELSDIDINLE